MRTMTMHADGTGQRLARLLSSAIDSSGKSRRDIAREAGLHKDTLLRVLRGSREFTVDEADRILSACGIPAPAVLCLVASGRDDLAASWLRSGFVEFLDRFYRELPGALREGLGERMDEIPPRWALGASRLLAKQLARHVDELSIRDFG